MNHDEATCRQCADQRHEQAQPAPILIPRDPDYTERRPKGRHRA